MRIIEAAPDKARSIRLDAIPVRSVFRGTLTSKKDGREYPGTFYKAQGEWRNTVLNGHQDCIVVRLNDIAMPVGRANIWLHGSSIVTNYQRLEAELVIKGVLA